MNKQKTVIALALVALIGIIGITVAYFTSRTTLTNEFIAGIYSTSVTEKFVSPSDWTPGTTTPKTVNVTNNGNVDVAVRAIIKESWLAADNTTVLSGIRDGESVAQFKVGENWQQAEDGKYYYIGILGPGKTTSDFISEVTFNPNFKLEDGTDIKCTETTVDGKTTVNCVNLNTGYAGATYTLEITIETIQADQRWPYTAVFSEGDVVVIENEMFNVVSYDDETVTLLAKYNLGTDYRQTKTQNGVTFSENIGWEYTPGPKEIDIQAYDGETKTYINEYVAYLKDKTGDVNITGTLMTLSQLKDLGCNINDDYIHAIGGIPICADSEHISWLANGQRWWTRSAHPLEDKRIWRLNGSGLLYSNFNYDFVPVRPVITMSRNVLKGFNYTGKDIEL